MDRRYTGIQGYWYSDKDKGIGIGIQGIMDDKGIEILSNSRHGKTRS